MGRPEPVVLFAQTILHSQLDEYVDEVSFPSFFVCSLCNLPSNLAAAWLSEVSVFELDGF
jgi:hypothetical protein